MEMWNSNEKAPTSYKRPSVLYSHNKQVLIYNNRVIPFPDKCINHKSQDEVSSTSEYVFSS